MTNKKIVEVKELSQLEPASKGFVDIQREDKLLRIPVKGLSLKEQEEIEEKYQVPEPPKMWKKVQGSDSPILVKADDDPKYLKNINNLRKNSGREMVIRGLDILVPGETIEEKWEALLDTGLVIGDLEKLTQKILELSNLTNKDIEAAKSFFG